MKPKTALECKIVALSNNLPVITQQQNNAAFSKCFDKYAVQSRKSIFCLECGNIWKVNDNKKYINVTCDKCSRKLIVTDKYRNGVNQTDYYQIITSVDKFQIIRMVCITKNMKKNKECSFWAHEVMQIFIDEKGKTRSLSKNVMGLSQYFD